jgi:hypothetical protein
MIFSENRGPALGILLDALLDGGRAAPGRRATLKQTLKKVLNLSARGDYQCVATVI